MQVVMPEVLLIYFNNHMKNSPSLFTMPDKISFLNDSNINIIVDIKKVLEGYLKLLSSEGYK
jgi:hypothetical protein